MNTITRYHCGICDAAYKWASWADECCQEPTIEEDANGAKDVLYRDTSRMVARTKDNEYALFQDGQPVAAWVTEGAAQDVIRLLEATQ